MTFKDAGKVIKSFNCDFKDICWRLREQYKTRSEDKKARKGADVL